MTTIVVRVVLTVATAFTFAAHDLTWGLFALVVLVAAEEAVDERLIYWQRRTIDALKERHHD